MFYHGGLHDFIIIRSVREPLEGKQMIFHFCFNKEIHTFLPYLLVQERSQVPEKQPQRAIP